MNNNDPKNNDDPKDYNDLPNDPFIKDPVEEGDVLHPDDDTNTPGLGAAQDVNNIPDSTFVDGNIQEVNRDIEENTKEG